MRRLSSRVALVGVVGALLASAGPATSQSPPRVPRIGYVLLGPMAETPSPERAAFLEGLQELGYAVGRNLLIEYRSASLQADFLPDLVDELIALKVDVLVTVDTRATQAALARTSTIPVVFPSLADPEAIGLTNLARPGGNATGITFVHPELGGKRLALLKQAAPRISRVAVLWNPRNPGTVREWGESQAAARALGLRLQSFELRSVQQLDALLAAIARERPDALLTLADPLTTSVRTFVVEFAAKHRLPAMYGFREFADAGGLLFYGPIVADGYKRAATYVDRILKGAKPGDLPVERPTRFELVVNMRTARAMRLKIPPSLFLQADRVLE
jgi:putative ABC transport system substrate-binding protein